tara:strand:- start:1209 stop:1376 length:168 start_codon:yes stop_codon:yes gene_type:complete
MEEVVAVSVEVEIRAELWDAFKYYCEEEDLDPHTELKQTLTEYISSVKEENEAFS